MWDQANTLSQEGAKLTLWGEPSKNTVSQEETKLSLWGETKKSHCVTRRNKAYYLRRDQAKTLLQGTKLTIWGETKQKHCYKGQSLLSEARPSKNTVTRDKAYYLRRDQAKTLLQGTKLTIWGETKQKTLCHQKEQSLLSEERPSKNTVTRDKAYYPRRDQAKTLCYKKGPCLLDNISLKSTANSLICSPTVSPLKQSIIYSAGSRSETKQTHCVTRRSQSCHVTVSLKSANSLIHSPTVSLLKQLFTQHTVGSVLSSEACVP